MRGWGAIATPTFNIKFWERGPGDDSDKPGSGNSIATVGKRLVRKSITTHP